MSLPARDFGLRTVAPFILILAGGLALFGANAMNRPGRNDVTPEVSDPGSLMDLRGAKRQLGALGGDRGLVCCFLGVDCPVTEAYVDDLRRLHEEFSARGVAVVAIYSGASDHMNRVAAHALDCEFPFDVLIDRYQRMARNLGVERTPTFCLVDANRRLRYVGRFDDRFISEHQQQTPESADLRQAIEAVISQQDPPIARTVANGSPIEPWRRRRSDEPPAYAEHVAPIIERRCQTCHHRAGAGPFPLETEMQVARMRYVIADAVAQRRMPPWHADERFGEFHNDRRLTDEERRTLLSWAVQRGGRELQRPGRTRDQRRGSLADPVPWSIGEPDAIVDCADEFEIPAAGEITVKYSRVSKETTEALFEEVRWIQAAEVLPGNIQAVNHIAAFVTEPGSTLNMGPVTSGNILAEWTPGVPSFEFPPGTAFRVPRGARLVFEIHYRAIGVNVVDRPQLALRFADAAPEHEIQVATQYHDSFRIPRFAPQYTADFELEFACDTRLLGLFPRMRRRGSAFRFEATYPDGATETLLSIPRYDAAWQTTYWLDEPKPMPQGTRIRAIAHWDNSPGNAANPDPGVDVVHGARANDEMMATRVFFATEPALETGAAPIRFLGSPLARSSAAELARSLEAHPDDLAARYDLAAAHTAAGDREAAIAAYEEILKWDPDSPRARRRLVTLLLETGQPSAALVHLRWAEEKHPDDVDLRISLSRTLAQLGQAAPAAEHAQTAVALAEESFDARFQLGTALMAIGELNKAEAAFRRAMAIEPEDAATQRKLGLLLAARGDAAGAAEAFAVATRSDPTDAESWSDLGAAHFAAGQPAEAVRAYREALYVAPDHAGAANGLAWCLATTDDDEIRNIEEAVALAEQLRDLDKENPTALDTLAAAYAADGKFAEAEKVARRAIKLAEASDKFADLTEAMKARLQLYVAGQPYRAAAANHVGGAGR